jgi:hypothetical protein
VGRKVRVIKTKLTRGNSLPDLPLVSARLHPSSSEPGPDASNVMIGGLNPSGCSKIFSSFTAVRRVRCAHHRSNHGAHSAPYKCSSFTACPRSSTGKEHRVSTSKCAGSNPAGGSKHILISRPRWKGATVRRSKTLVRVQPGSPCRSRPIAGRERAKLETWVRFPAFAPV